MKIKGSKLYLAQQVKEGEQQIALEQNRAMYQLMEEAGKSVFNSIVAGYSGCKRLLVLCGSGNNGGDGYVTARLALLHGYKVTLWQMGSEESLKGDAAKARDNWLAVNGQIAKPETILADDIDLIVDGLLGTGLSGAVREEYQSIIQLINQSPVPVVSIDVPSGLSADTGAVLGCAVEADKTITFIASKQGLFTGCARDYCGEIVFAGLGIADDFSQKIEASSLLLSAQSLSGCLTGRKPTSHKGHFGRVLCMGGDRGMFGAIRLASEACARTGSGLTRVVTQPENVSAIVSARPELMVFDWRGNSNEINDHLHWADVLLIGPGLGTTSWGRSLMGYSASIEKRMVVDADGLNLLARVPDFNSRRIITPHPGEAARLLNCTIDQIESDRFSSVMRLQRKYGGVAVLKGAGTLIYDGKQLYVCNAGNPGMASGGMGDVLSGVIAGLLAQNLTLTQAACFGVWLHSTAADRCVQEHGEIGMLASDLYPYLRQLLATC